MLQNRNSSGLVCDDGLKEVPHLPRVREILRHLRLPEHQKRFHLLSCLRIRHILIFSAVQIEDGKQLIHRIVREFNELVEAALKSRIRMNKGLHRLCVTRHNDDKFIPVILHCLQNRINGLLTKIRSLICGSCQRIGFINEKNTAHRLFNFLLRLHGSLPDITGNQSGPVTLHKLSCGQYTDLLVQSRKDSCHRGLAGSRISCKNKMHRHRNGLHSRVLAKLLNLRKIIQLPDVMLDSGQSDQLIQILHRIGFRLLLLGLCLLCLCLLPDLRFRISFCRSFSRRDRFLRRLPGHRPRHRNIILPVEFHCSLHQRCLRAGERIHLLLQSALRPSVRRRIRRFSLRVRSSCLRFPGRIRFTRLHSRPV